MTNPHVTVGRFFSPSCYYSMILYRVNDNFHELFIADGLINMSVLYNGNGITKIMYHIKVV